jgi:cobalt-precorrin 5A hydrolase / precorrin-3B C17-methyltransferase
LEVIKITTSPQTEESLWVGIGYQRGTSKQVLAAAIAHVCRVYGLAETAIIGVGTIDRKAHEPGLLELGRDRGWQLRFYAAECLNQVQIPHPSPLITDQVGTASVAEAAALLAAGSDRDLATAVQLPVSKQVFRLAGQPGSVTVAIASSSLGADDANFKARHLDQAQSPRIETALATAQPEE